MSSSSATFKANVPLPVSGTNGGTGVNNGASTITLGGSLTTSGAFSTTLTVTANTNVTLPTSGTLVNSAVATLSNLTSVGTVTVGTWSSSITGATINNTTTNQSYRPLNNQTGTSYGLILSDGGTMVTLSNAAAITLTIPANSSVAFPVGTEIDLVQLGAGQVTVAITTDTLDSYTAKVKLAGQYAGGTLKKVTSTSWVLIGNLA